MPTTHGWIILCIATTWMLQPRAPGRLPLAPVRPRTIAFTGPPLPGPAREVQATLEHRPPGGPPAPAPDPAPAPVLPPGFRF